MDVKLCVLAAMLAVSVSMQDSDNLADSLWEANKDIAKKVYGTTFIQGIRDNSLDEVVFRKFNMADILYMTNTHEAIAIAVYQWCKDVSHQNEACALLRKILKLYPEYVERMCNDTNLKNVDGIKRTPAIEKYSEFYRSVTIEAHSGPEYFLVALYPHIRLWNWFANDLDRHMEENNVYRSWIKGNMGDIQKSSLTLCINNYTFPDVSKAYKAFHLGMEKELVIFEEASSKPAQQRPKFKLDNF